jgi:hypothetical protein
MYEQVSIASKDGLFAESNKNAEKSRQEKAAFRRIFAYNFEIVRQV